MRTFYLCPQTRMYDLIKFHPFVYQELIFPFGLLWSLHLTFLLHAHLLLFLTLHNLQCRSSSLQNAPLKRPVYCVLYRFHHSVCCIYSIVQRCTYVVTLALILLCVAPWSWSNIHGPPKLLVNKSE